MARSRSAVPRRQSGESKCPRSEGTLNVVAGSYAPRSAVRCGHLARRAFSGHRVGLDEEQGIYRDEVRLIMGALAGSRKTRVASSRFSETRRVVMKKKWTPEEWRAWRAAREARLRELRQCIAPIDAELAGK